MEEEANSLFSENSAERLVGSRPTDATYCGVCKWRSNGTLNTEGETLTTGSSPVSVTMLHNALKMQPLTCSGSA